MSNINPAIADLVVPITELTPYDGNAKRHDLPTIAASLKANSQYKPLTVRRSDDPNRHNVVLAGNGTLEAARDLLHWTEIAISYVECDDATARRIVLVDNRSNELGGGYDGEALAALLAGLNGDFDGTGFDQDDLDDLLDELAPPDSDPNAGTGMGEPVIRYEVVFDTEDQQKRFYRHLRTLRDRYPDVDSIAERLVLHFNDTLDTPDDPEA